LIILAYFYVRTFLSPRSQRNNLYFNVTAPGGESTFGKINETLLKHVRAANLRRLDSTVDNLQATYLIQLPDDEALATLMDNLRANLPACEFSFVEQDNTLGG
jgi:hypothetical protein